jgi:exopolyphosphatase / guanosine-5'-triphosphate,3'-diphosphate pyrophosphatase
MRHGDMLAAIDLGSNSYRLEIGRVDHGQILRAEYLKETVRQGSGLDAESKLDEAAMRRGLDCLARFAERLHGFDERHVRAVATQTLREASNREEFLRRARGVLGYPIEVISGREEARLIYSGVSHLLPESDERRLVVDIGGRSTEVVLGQGTTPRKVESYPVGSVGLSMRHFADGRLTKKAFDAAVLGAQAVLEGALGTLEGLSWDAAYGSSGTIGAVADLLVANQRGDGTITVDALDWLLDELLRAGHVDRVRLTGLRDDRRAVIGGGLATLRAVFALLGLDRMQAARGALRHGVLYEMLDRREATRDVRERTVQRLQQKFGVDAAQAARVRVAAQALLAQLRPAAEDEMPALLRKLGWAADLHEIGMAVSHADYHRHGAYILEHSDAAGFAQHQFERLGALLLGQRGGLRKVATALDDPTQCAQLLCLRLAVLLCHARRDPRLDGVALALDAGQPALAVTAGWAEAHPRSMVLLEEEAAHWARIGRRFAVTVAG